MPENTIMNIFKSDTFKDLLWVTVGIFVLALPSFFNITQWGRQAISPMTFDNWLQIAIFVILAVTARIIWAYTKAAQQSNEIMLRPIVNAYFAQDSFYRFWIKNIGKGPAYNISIQDVEIENHIFKFLPSGTGSILEPTGSSGGSREEIDVLAFSPSGGFLADRQIDLLLAFLSPRTFTPDIVGEAKKLSVIFRVVYQDINGMSYYSIFKFYTKHPGTEEYIMEFIESKKGECSKEEALRLCSLKNKMESSYETRRAARSL